ADRSETERAVAAGRDARHARLLLLGFHGLVCGLCDPALRADAATGADGAACLRTRRTWSPRTSSPRPSSSATPCSSTGARSSLSPQLGASLGQALVAIGHLRRPQVQRLVRRAMVPRLK